MSRSGVGDRLLDVLESFAEGPWHQTLDEVQQSTGLPRATVHRMLQLLVRRGWLEHSPAGYRLGARMLGAAHGTVSYRTLRAAAAQALLDLHRASGAAAHLSVLEGAMTCHLDKVASGLAWQEVPSHIGVRLPATETAAGLSILAQLPPEDVDRVLQLQQEAGVAAVDRVWLDHELAAVRRRRGVALKDGRHRASGINTAAAAVQGPNGPVATISIAWKRAQPTPSAAAALVLEAVRRTAAELTRR